MELLWHPYRYYPYERSLALREVDAMLAPASLREHAQGIFVDRPKQPDAVTRLVYVASAADGQDRSIRTQQSELERANRTGAKRQSTRYSVHGLHEYKGKFNPQVAKAILNIFGADREHHVLDPFCGSGTALVECAHLGIRATGMDINPLAVYLANAKLKSLGTPAEDLKQSALTALKSARRSRAVPQVEDPRGSYLKSWFPPDVLVTIERLRTAVESMDSDTSVPLLALASNLLRDYSLQEPGDLRIRRRRTPLPDEPFLEAFERAVLGYCSRLQHAQDTLGIRAPESAAVHADCRSMQNQTETPIGPFDMALTSPPYASALPYIDTQRLSLVWLNLLQPEDVLALEAKLVGSREIRGESRKELISALRSNTAGLPAAEHDFCSRLQGALGENDGFRRQAVPSLLYRYFAAMAEAFSAIRRVMRPDSRFALIVGGNHTVLSGLRFNIDTPGHLVNLAISKGWRHLESLPLQTYQRFGLHMSNATNSETLVVLQS